MRGLIERLYRRTAVNDIVARLPDDAPMARAEVDRLVKRELQAIPTSIIEHYRYQDREARILNDRLSRRFDPGQALNEATQRAVAEKQAMQQASPDTLTAKQKLALEVQQAHLTRVIRDS